MFEEKKERKENALRVDTREYTQKTPTEYRECARNENKNKNKK